MGRAVRDDAPRGHCCGATHPKNRLDMRKAGTCRRMNLQDLAGAQPNLVAGGTMTRLNGSKVTAKIVFRPLLAFLKGGGAPTAVVCCRRGSGRKRNGLKNGPSWFFREAHVDIAAFVNTCDLTLFALFTDGRHAFIA